MNTISCQVIPAGDVAPGDVLWVTVDGFQRVVSIEPLGDNAVTLVLSNRTGAIRFCADQAIIQARRTR